MIIGVVKEIKPEEYRVAAPPMAVAALTHAGHKVIVQSQAGVGSGFEDQEYINVGATVVNSADKVWELAEMVYHVKEPMPSEFRYFRKGLIFFSFLHLAVEKELTLALVKSGMTAIAFETIQLPNGTLPLLEPMSAVAGKVAVLVGAQYLGRMYQGSGRLICSVPGVPPAKVVILGGGVVGSSAARSALGLGARVLIIDKDVFRLKYLEDTLNGRFETVASNPYIIANAVKEADIVIGAVLVSGARAPLVVTRDMVKSMKPGSVIIDASIDQGGCIETSRPTSHTDPIYIEEGVIHYCVPNMPGIYPRTSTVALSNATLRYTLELANQGFLRAILSDECIAKGVNIFQGNVTNSSVATSLELEYKSLSEVLNFASHAS